MTTAEINQIKKWITSCEGPAQFDLIRDFVDKSFDKGFLTKDQFSELLVCLNTKLDELQATLNKIRFGMNPHQVVNVFAVQPQNVNNIFTNPGPNEPMEVLANTAP